MPQWIPGSPNQDRPNRCLQRHYLPWIPYNLACLGKLHSRFFVKNITFVMPHCQQTYGVLFWKQHRCRVTFANSLWRFLLDTANSIALTIAIWYPLLSASVEPIMSFPHSDCHWAHRWNADYKNGAHRIIKSLIAHMELLFLKYYLPTAWL